MLFQRIEIYPGIGYGNSLVVLFCGGKDMDAVFVHVVKVGINNILLYEEYILPQFQNMKQLTRSELFEMKCLYLYIHNINHNRAARQENNIVACIATRSESSEKQL